MEPPRDHAAIERIVEDHASSVLRIARGMVGNEADAEDVVQEVFIRAMRALPSFRGGAKMSTWLHRIAINASLSFIQKRRAEADRRRAAAVELRDSSSPRGAPAADEALERRELRSAVQRMLDELPPEQRAVVVLREIEGLRFGEIAEALECPVATAESRMIRARARMRELWKQHDPGRERAAESGN